MITGLTKGGTEWTPQFAIELDQSCAWYPRLRGLAELRKIPQRLDHVGRCEPTPKHRPIALPDDQQCRHAQLWQLIEYRAVVNHLVSQG